ncbi:MAG: hypothetical protein QM610_04025 [Chitinophagaceae bacterium]
MFNLTGVFQFVVDEQYVARFVEDASLVSEAFCEDRLEEGFVFQGFTVVNVGVCEGEVQNFLQSLMTTWHLKITSRSSITGVRLGGLPKTKVLVFCLKFAHKTVNIRRFAIVYHNIYNPNQGLKTRSNIG